MQVNGGNFHKAIEGAVSARNHEAARMVARRFEHQLIGALTKRPG